MNEKIVWLEGQIHAREQWIDDHGSKNKWPAHLIETKQHGLEMLRDIHSDYSRSLEKAKARDDQNNA